MKREASSPANSDTEHQSDTTLPELKKAKRQSEGPHNKKSRGSMTTPKSAKTSSTEGAVTWDADGREALMQHLIAEGLKNCDKAELAEKFGVTKSKLHNELSLGRHGNMRARAVKAARGD